MANSSRTFKGLLRLSEAVLEDRGEHAICLDRFVLSHLVEKLVNNDIVMVISLGPVHKTKRVLDRELILGDGLKYEQDMIPDCNCKCLQKKTIGRKGHPGL